MCSPASECSAHCKRCPEVQRGQERRETGVRGEERRAWIKRGERQAGVRRGSGMEERRGEQREQSVCRRARREASMGRERREDGTGHDKVRCSTVSRCVAHIIAIVFCVAFPFRTAPTPAAAGLSRTTAQDLSVHSCLYLYLYLYLRARQLGRSEVRTFKQTVG
jgi:hypothetical protein